MATIRRYLFQNGGAQKILKILIIRKPCSSFQFISTKFKRFPHLTVNMVQYWSFSLGNPNFPLRYSSLTYEKSLPELLQYPQGKTLSRILLIPLNRLLARCRYLLRMHAFCQIYLTVRQYPFILLGGERHCESKVSCPRTLLTQ